MRRFGAWGVWSLAVGLGMGCGDDAPKTPADTLDAQGGDSSEADADSVEGDTAADDTAGPDAAEVDTEPGPRCDYTEPQCSDEQIAMLSFARTASGGAIVEEGTTPNEFLSHIDATAGGFNGTLGYTYARFTDDGLVAVELSDEDALESMDWDIALRRYVARLNSGVSGPSCVEGGRAAPTVTFEDLTEVPTNLTFRAEQYFTQDGCEYLPETSGIGSPQTILSSFWRYEGCVGMTGNLYVVRLRDGRHVKLQFQSYYNPAVQETCDATGSAPTPNGAGNIRLRWAFID